MWILLSAAAATALVDLLWPLPPSIRSAASLGLATGAAIVIGLGVVAGYLARRRSVDGIAVLLEGGRPELANALVNAVQLSRELAAAGPWTTSPVLAAAEIQRGRAACGLVAPAAVADRARLKRHRSILLIMMSGLAATGLVWPDFWAAAVPRLADPAGDHPPYCRTRFAVRYEGSNPDGLIYHGDSVKVVVDLAGSVPESAWLVVEQTGGLRRVDLFRKSETQWFVRFENLQEDLRFRVHVPDGHSKRQILALAPAPRITQAVVAYVPPGYTGRQPYEEPITSAGIRGLRGTRAEIRLRANRPLAGGTIRWADGGTGVPGVLVPSEPEGTEARAVLTIDRNDRFTATVTATNGIESIDRVEAAVHVIEDAPPTVGFDEPGCDALAVEDAAVPLVIRAADDIGLRRVRLHRTVNGGSSQSLDLPVSPGEATVRKTWLLDARELGLRAGDAVEYYATATDTHPDPPQSTDTPVYRISIVSRAEYTELLRQQAGTDWLREQYEPLMGEFREIARRVHEIGSRMEHAADELTQAPGKLPLAPELRRRFQDLAEADQALRQNAADLTERMQRTAQAPPLYDVQEHLNRQVRQLAEELRIVAGRQTGRRLGEELERPEMTHEQLVPAVARALADLREDIRRLAGPESRDTCRAIAEPIETLEQVCELTALIEEFKNLAKRQQDLAVRAKRLADGSEYIEQDKPDFSRYAEAQSRIAEQTASVRNGFETKAREVRQFAEHLAAEPPRESFDRPPADAPGSQPVKRNEEDARPARARRLDAFATGAAEIAAHIRQLGVEADMRTAAERLAAGDGERGHRAAQRAADKMASMITKCQAVGGDGSACLSLDIVEFGQSLEQMMQAMRPAIAATGNGAGSAGQGQAGQAASGADTMVYGPLSPGGGAAGDSQKRTVNARMALPPEAAPPLRVEMIAPESVVEIDVGPVGREPVPARYRDLTEAYFRRLAEEDR